MYFAGKQVFTLIIFTIILSTKSASIVQNENTTVVIPAKNENTLANSYNELLQDVRWFFQRLEDFALTAERILPNVSLTQQTRTFPESTRLNFLIGLRHLLTGIKELSVTIRKSLEADHMQQFQYVIQATNTIHEAFNTLKTWITSLRALAGRAFRVYNRHIPEVLLGKCLGRYIVSKYPERTFYEYPILLLNDILSTIFQQINETQKAQNSTQNDIDDITNISTTMITTTTTTTTENISIEQNEIPHSDKIDYKNAFGGRALEDSVSNNDDYFMNFLNFNDVLEQDSEKVIDSAVETHSWQKCIKMYTAETIVRKLKVYFLEMD